MAKRKVGLLVMLLAFVTALTIGVVGCTGDGGEGNNSANNSSNNAGYDFNGEYYTEIDGVTYTLSFNDKMYSMTLGNLSGAFEYDGTTLTLKGNNSLSAQMNNQAITVTYNGKTYRFLKKVNYTVTFETNGGSNVPNATVLNGKTVSKPADPEKTDCEFIGWYADAGFKAPFLFGTAITADTKLYARFAEKSSGATEFTATFSDSAGGNYEPQTTVGGKLYNLPTPTDSTFAGWYVSDTDNANKLTYKYEEQTLYQNVTLYAVYGDGTPQPSVTDAGIKWSPAGAGAEYALTVVGPDGASYGPYNMSSNEYKFNFSDKPEGEYAVTLTVKGVKKTAYYTNKGLAKVSVFTAEDNLFRYNAVPNAEKYYITVECGNENHNHTAYDNGTSLYYDFSGCSMKEGGIKFTVTAVAEGYVSSTSDAYYFDRSLAAVTGFKVENDTATWNAVEGAEGYTVEITQGNSLITKNVGNETSYSLKFYTGNMTVKVYANKADYNSSSSDAVAYNKTTLAAPAGLTMNGSTMSWNKVDGATGYEVTVNGNKFAATTNSFDFTANNVASASEYNVTVTAKASTAANDSQASDAMTVHAADTKDVIAYADGYVTWNYTMGAQYHEVKVNNQEAVKVTGTNKYEVPFNGAGEYTVSVRHNYGSMKYTAWVSITVTVYAVEFDVKGGDNIPTKYMAAGDKFDTKEPTMLGYDFAGWYTVPGGASVNGKEYTDTTFNAASDMTLYAYYTPKTYTVTLDTTAGTGETTAKVTYKNDYVLPVPTANDAANGFVGWYTEPNGNGLKYTNELGESLDVWQNVVEIKLYAYWTAYFEFLPVSNGTAWSVMGTAGMKNATYIKVPASYQGKPVVTVDGGAFLNCVKLEKVEIPNTVTLIEVDTAFSNCQKLEEVVIYDAKAEYPDDVAVQNAERGDYTSVDGVLFHPGENDPAPEIVFFPRGKEGRYVIPDGTAVISANVFTQAKITEVVIPSSVTQIQTNAFYYSKLTKVTFVSGNDDVPLTISARAFSSCEGLTTITFPKRLASFDSTLFKYCTALEAVNIDGVGENYCSIDGVVMNADATEILYVPVAFKGVDGVYEVPMSVTKIGGGQVGNVDGDSKNGGAFAGCKAIKTVVFHGNVTEIGENAFRLCYVQEVVFEGNTKDGVTLAIKEGAFSMSRLTAVTLPNYLTEVGENAFYGCSRLKEVTIATTGNVTIAAGSFLSNSGNSNIETVNIGKDVPELELTGIFGTRVVNVNIDPANTNYTEIEGVIYNPQITTLLYYPLGKTGNFTFPATLNKIGNNVFQYKSNLTEINIPKTITEIGAYAFQGCENLATVTFDNDRTEALTIGAYAFANIPAETIAIPDMTTEIGNGAFSNSAFYTISIPASVAKMGAYDDNGVLTAMSVFTGCNNLYSITIAADNANFYTDAAGVVYLKDNGEAKELIYAVKGAVPEGVTTATEVTIPATVTKIWDSIFENNNKVTKVVFTNTATITLGKNVFSHASALKEVTLSTGFTSIPNNMFIECSSLESIDIPYTVTSIGAGAFKNCVSLETVTFSGNRMNEAGTAAAYPLTIADAGGTSSSGKYGYSAAGVFVGCLKLKNLVLPEGTTTIGSSAFMTEEKALDAYFADPNTTDLGLESIYIPSTVTTIGAQAFAGIPVEQAASKSRNINADAYFNNVISGLKTVTFADGCKITQIPNGAFAFTNITSIRIPAKVTTFAASAFHGTPNLKTMTFEEGAVLNTLQSDSVASSGLTSVTLPATVKQLVMRAFKFCYDLETVNFEVNATTGNSALANVSGRTPAPAVGNYVFAYSGLTSISFPKAANPYSLGTNLFEGCKNLTEVTLSESVTNIDNTFAGNISVQKINVAEGSSFAMEGFEDEVNHTYSYVLMFGNNNTSISLVLGKLPETFTVPEGITTIGVRAFGGHSEMKHLVIPAAVTTIGSYGFTECEGLESVTFTGAQDGGAGASQLINLGTYAFYGCTNLQSVVLPNSLTKVTAHAFENCSSLESVTFGSNVTELQGYSFANTGLKSVTLPDSLNNLGEFGEGNISGRGGSPDNIKGYVFYNCTNLESVDLATVQLIGYYVFAGCSSLKQVTIPASVQYIASHAFDGAGLTSLDIPATVIGLGSNNPTGGNGSAFDGTNIYGTNQVAVFANCADLKTVTFNGTNITMLPHYLFYNCPSLTTIEFKNNGETVTNSFPEYVTYVGHYVLAGTGVKSFEFTNMPTFLGAGVFSGCKALTDVVLYRDMEFENGQMTGYATTMTNNAYGNSFFFENCENLVNVGYVNEEGKLVNGELPDTVSEIPVGFFKGCTNLVNFKVSDYIAEIGAYAFSGCKKWTADDGVFTLPSYVMELTPYMLQDCDSITTVVLHSKIKFNDMFNQVDNAGSPNWDWKVVGFNSFSGMDNLTDIVIPASFGFIVKDGLLINDGVVFYAFQALVSGVVDMPEEVTTIAACAFEGNDNVTGIVLNNVKYIGQFAFRGCDNFDKSELDLSEVYYATKAF